MSITREELEQGRIKAEAAIFGMLKEKSIAVEELTRDQLAEALRQALRCGDFMRVVRVGDGAQQVVYLPGVGNDNLRSQLDEAKDLLRRLKDNPSSVTPTEIETFLAEPLL